MTTLSVAEKQKIIAEFGKSSTDTGSPQVQIALLTASIQLVTEHLRTHPKDHAGRRGLLGMVSRRRQLLDYLKRKSVTQYQEMISRLNLRK